MTNYLRAGKGVLIFILGWIIAGISWYTVPTFISLFDSALLQGIFWGGLILIWVLLIVVLPASEITQAMQE